MKRIALLTSGGDAPGMNAAIHSIVMSCHHEGIEVIGFDKGFNGLLDNEYHPLTHHDVKHIIHMGGTILKSARCHRLMESEYQTLAAKHLNQLNLDGLIVIGGDGSFRGGAVLSGLTSVPVIGVPATIDNDLEGTDATIGFYTAVQTAVEAVDKIRDTADAFERIFIVEVMGRNSGFLALDTGIATEAELIICPEMRIDVSQLAENIAVHNRQYIETFGHSSYIIVMAENTYPGGASALAFELSKNRGIECRATVLGHIQRGGNAIANDRLLASKLGDAAVEALQCGLSGKMVGLVQGKIKYTRFDACGLKEKAPDPYLMHLYQTKLMT